MLQRSPSYVCPAGEGPDRQRRCSRLLPDAARLPAHAPGERRAPARHLHRSKRYPRARRRLLRAMTKLQLPSRLSGRHALQPELQPVGPAAVRGPGRRPVQGDQRPARRRSSPTGSPRFTERGILLESGARARGRHHRHRDRPEHARRSAAWSPALRRRRGIALNETVAYKSMMLSGVPNFVFALGYTNFSWTLKVDLVCEHLCRLLVHMDACCCR